MPLNESSAGHAYNVRAELSRMCTILKAEIQVVKQRILLAQYGGTPSPGHYRRMVQETAAGLLAACEEADNHLQSAFTEAAQADAEPAPPLKADRPLPPTGRMQAGFPPISPAVTHLDDHFEPPGADR